MISTVSPHLRLRIYFEIRVILLRITRWSREIERTDVVEITIRNISRWNYNQAIIHRLFPRGIINPRES